MVRVVAVVSLVLSALGAAIGIKLDGNGYTDLLIAINPAVPQNNELINRIKTMITKGSEYLLEALDRKVFIKEVNILVPPTWTGSFAKARRETYDKANVIVGHPNTAFGDEPYTKQMKGCGEEGEHIHFTPDFLLKDDLLKVFGPREKVFVHEWAHLRWGVFDEYNKKQPFYWSKTQEIEHTRCSGKIAGKLYDVSSGSPLPCSFDPKTGLPTKGCKFIPNKDQKTSSSIMFMPSLDAVKTFCEDGDHNTEAPNRQNKECNFRSTRTIIYKHSVDSAALKTLTPLKTKPPPPKFRVVQRKSRATCLILDVSGSMSGERIRRQQQAAALFLSEIVEEGASVAIVQFSNDASIRRPLTKIKGKASRDALIKNLPTSAGGGTYMCKGLLKSLEVLKADDGDTIGDDVIFLTDGEASDDINTCFQTAVKSGAIINTLALGPSASVILKTMADQTGGKFVVAKDDLLSNQLVEAFSSFSFSDGDPIKQTVQLESIGKNTADWFNGTVPIDRTVGNSTTFTVIYERATPTVYIKSSSGRVYTQAHIKDDTASKTITLNIPGTAEPGVWKYSFLNRKAPAQTMTLTVTSRAAHDSVPPLIVTAKMNKLSSDGSKPLVVYAEVSQNLMPVLGANVTATLQSDTGHSVQLYLLDNGAAADNVKDDGIYSRYFTYLKSGRYSLKVKVTDRTDTKRSLGKPSGALYVPGYIVNGKVELNPQEPPVNVEPANVGSFSRIATGESFVVKVASGVTPNFPPNRIRDLSAEFQNDNVLLNWTAPGEIYDEGTAKSYEIRWSENLEMLQKNFSGANLLNTSGLQPKEVGSAEQHHFLPDTQIKNGTTLFFAIQAKNKKGVKSELSNIARVTKFLPTPEEPAYPGFSLVIIIKSMLRSFLPQW
ncbi:calcium-activated chloride channel regulator 1 [Astyanax mexicanus]|uniref:calcium-activated chloride channel regulator 1 n=1 Tax=Astyanax mexicanus TaxID=7994 RepID=UPI0020CACC71|nr:calcium-activated chloride channel regulator 1 [Astyanax mexicanus]XP_049323311.1 calcium-activated chloride channel regulator 1 [Astyanax mexicanus]